MTHRHLVGLLPAAALSACAHAGLSTTVFDFDEEPLGLTGLTAEFTQDGTDILVELEENILRIVDPNLFVQGWGPQSLLLGGGFRRSPMTISFEHGAAGFGIEFGDLGGKGDTVHFAFYSGASGTGTLLYEEEVVSYAPIHLGPPDSFYYAFDGGLEGDGLGIGSVVIETAGSFGNPSLFFDNLSVTVPAPASVVIVACPLAVASRRRRG